MAVRELEIQGYRSLRKVHLPLERLNVVTGPNGSGKSNLYHALWLITQICEGSFARAICREGGLLSAMWAGERTSKKPLRMSLGFSTEAFAFELSCGFPQPADSQFCYDPEIKEESIWVGKHRKPTTTLLHRQAGITHVRDAEGNRVAFPMVLGENESVLSQLREPHRFPELFAVREEVRGWRFYHQFRTDAESPMRTPQISVRTPILSQDGSDLAAALQTILEIGDSETLNTMIASALPGRSLVILGNDSPFSKSPRFTELSVALDTAGCARPLLARELSDGTLKFLCLAAALLTPRPPSLIALNEPGSSLHPDLLPPLAELIVNASTYSQVWISTHATTLVERIHELSGVQPIRLQLVDGETVVLEDG